jgi:cytochrome c oxidase assembly factor CtaG
MPIKSPDPQASILLFTWQTYWVSFVALAVQVAVLAEYLARVRRLDRRGRHWSVFRTLCFVLGAVIVAYAFEGGIAHYQSSNFTAHVVQVLLLVDVGPPLLALGAPITLALQSSSRRHGALLVGMLRSWPVQAVSQPLVAFAITMGSMFVYFLSPIYQFSVQHPLFLAFAHLYFVLVGLLLWVLIAGQDGLPRRLRFGMRFVLVTLLIPFNLALGLAVANVAQPLYPAGNTLADTQQGGNVLLGLAEVLVVAALALLFVEWAKEEERSAVRTDRQLDAALAAARAAVGPRDLTDPTDQPSEL